MGAQQGKEGHPGHGGGHPAAHHHPPPPLSGYHPDDQPPSSKSRPVSRIKGLKPRQSGGGGGSRTPRGQHPSQQQQQRLSHQHPGSPMGGDPGGGRSRSPGFPGGGFDNTAAVPPLTPGRNGT